MQQWQKTCLKMEVTNTLELKSIISCIIVASLVANSALVALSETWLTSVVLSFTELGMCGLTLQTLHMALTVFNPLWTCKGTIELFLTSLDAERTKTAETLKTDLLTFCVDVKSWYGGKIVIFATTAGAIWNTLVEILAKTELRTIFQTLTEPVVPKFYLQIILLTSSRSHHFTTQ